MMQQDSPSIAGMSTHSARNLTDLVARGLLWRGRGADEQATEATGHPALDACLPGGGWPCAALSEVLVARPGSGELGLCLPLLARLTAAGREVALVAPPLLPYAPALAAAGVHEARCVVVEPRAGRRVEDALWSAEQLLRSGAFGAVLLWLDHARENTLRRLALAAREGPGIGILLRPTTITQASPAALRLSLTAQREGTEVEVSKARGGHPGARVRL
jgi:Uncharacterized conserved protein